MQNWQRVSNLGLDGGGASVVRDEKLGALGVDHERDAEPFLVVEPPHGAHGGPVPLAAAVAEVDPRHAHPAARQRRQRLHAGGPHRANQLRLPHPHEPLLPQLRLRHHVHRRVPCRPRCRGADPLCGPMAAGRRGGTGD